METRRILFRLEVRKNEISSSLRILADTTMQLTGLKEETEYTFYITAQNEAGDSEKSEGVTLKTKKPGKIPTYFSQKIYSCNNQHKTSILYSLDDPGKHTLTCLRYPNGKRKN